MALAIIIILYTSDGQGLSKGGSPPVADLFDSQEILATKPAVGGRDFWDRVFFLEKEAPAALWECWEENRANLDRALGLPKAEQPAH